MTIKVLTHGVYLVCLRSGPSTRNERNRPPTNRFHRSLSSISSGLFWVPCPSWVVLGVLKLLIATQVAGAGAIWPGVVLVAFKENINISDKRFQTEHHPSHSRAASLQEPDEFVDIVTRNLLRLLQQEHGLRVSGQQSSEGSSVLAGCDREICVTVRPERGPLHQLDVRMWDARLRTFMM